MYHVSEIALVRNQGPRSGFNRKKRRATQFIWTRRSRDSEVVVQIHSWKWHDELVSGKSAGV